MTAARGPSIVAGSEPAPRARRVPVPDGEPLLSGASSDYADSFEIRPRASDPRSAEDFARDALEHAPRIVRVALPIVHRYVLRLQLGPRTSADHVAGWKIVTAQHDVIHLEAVSPLLGRGVIVARRPDPSRAVITTYVFFGRPVLSRAVWIIVSPLHRWVAPILLERAAAAQ